MATQATANQPQRQSPRWQITTSKPVRVDLGPAGAGSLVNISAGGMQVKSLAPLRRGAEIPIRIYVPDRIEAVQSAGIVVWSSASGSTGVRFVKFSDEHQRILNGWLSELEQAAKAEARPEENNEYSRVIARVKAEKLNNADALALIARRAVDLTSASGVTIALGTPLNMACMASSGSAPQVGTHVAHTDGLIGECVRSRKMVHCQNAQTDPRVNRELKVGSVAVLPLLVNGEMRGIMEVVSPTPHVFNIRSLENLLMLSDAAVFVAYGVVPQRRMAAVTSLKVPVEKPIFTAKNDSGVGVLPKVGTPIASRPQAVPVPPIDLSKPAPDLSPTATPILTIAESPVSSAASLAADPPMTAPVATVSPRVFTSVPATERTYSPATTPSVAPRRQYHVAAERYEVPRTSSSKKFVLPVAVFVVVAAIAIPLWLKLRNRPVEPANAVAAVAAPVAASSIGTVLNEASAVVTPTAQSTSIPVDTVRPQAVKITAPVTKEVRSHETPAAEKKPAPTQVVTAPKPEPIILAANTAPVKKPVEDAVYAPSVITVPAPVIPNVAVPANAAVPKLNAPRVLTGGAILQQVPPIYPQSARAMRIEGAVDLQAHVTPQGTVDTVKVKSGNPLLAAAAVEAVKKWKFDPQKLNGQPVDMEKSITLKFALPH